MFHSPENEGTVHSVEQTFENFNTQYGQRLSDDESDGFTLSQLGLISQPPSESLVSITFSFDNK